MESPLILVTGADGLVGRYVTRLLSQFHRVVAISRHGAFTREDGIHSINVDLGVALEVQRIADIRPDLIVHLAAALPVGPNDAAVASVNQLIDLHIFNLAKIADASVVFCSSVSVYENQPGPWLESLPLNPASAYALSKLQSERLFSDLAAGSASLRISSPYGATHLWRSGVLFHFARLSVAGKQLTICGDGNRTQDFVHAIDVAWAVAQVVESWNRREGLLARGVVNIASGVPVSMSELALLILDLTRNSHPLIFERSGEDEEQYRSQVSIARAASLKNWKPQISLRDGVEHLLEVLDGRNEDWFAVRRSW